MMKEEDHIDLTLSSEMSDISLTGNIASLSDVSSAKSSKASSVIGEMTGKLEEEDLLDDLGSFIKSSTSTPSHSVSGTATKLDTNLETESDNSKRKSVYLPQTRVENTNTSTELQNTTTSNAKSLFGNVSNSNINDSFGNLLIEESSSSSFTVISETEGHKKDSNIDVAYNNPNASNGIIQPSQSQVVTSNILTGPSVAPNHLHGSWNAISDNSQWKETSYFHVSEIQQNISQTQIQTGNYSTFENNQAIFSYTEPIPSTSVQGSLFTSQQFCNKEELVGQQNSQCLYEGNHQQQSQTNQPFIPSMYGYRSEEYQNPNIFTPSTPKVAPNDGQYKVKAVYSPPNNTYNSESPTNQYNSPINHVPSYPQNNSWQIQAVQKLGDDDETGIWDWVKSTMNTDWTEGAQKIGKQILQKTKTATDTVLTTLDPGMEEYLKPVVNIAVASQNIGIIQGIRHGFRGVFGHATAKGQHTVHSCAPLLIGFDAGIKATVEMLDNLTPINFEFNGSYVIVATVVFLTELQQGRWSAMFCLGLRDLHRNIELHSFSQPIPLPLECVTIAYQRTSPENVQQMSGYSIPIDEAVRLYKPYTEEHDWCFALAGISRQTVLTLAGQCLAADYKRHMENPRLNQVESLVVM